MGDAKRRRDAEKHVIDIDQSRVSAAIRQGVAAITYYGGSDCFLYAHIGPGILKSLGLDVKVVAGSASCRFEQSPKVA